MEFGKNGGAMKFDEDGGALALYGQIINDLIRDGMVPPYQMAALTDNGAVLAGRWEGQGTELTFHETARYVPPDGMGERSHILFVDAKGEPHVTIVVNGIVSSK